MAVTKIIPVRTSLQNSVDYICNPDKTDDRLLVHSEHCFPHTAGLEFQHYLSQARAGGNTVGRHLIQSFAPGEVTPEEAHEIGKKLTTEILKGEYGLVMATHVDRGHVHNHFVWRAVNVVTHRKYRSNKGTYHEIRKASDRLCKENELSVIEPKGFGKSYDACFPENTSKSWRGKLKLALDHLIPQAKDFEDLLRRIEAQGYKVKRGKYLSFRASGQERFTRSKSLGEGYTEEAIKAKILEKPELETEDEEKAIATAEPPPTIPLMEKPKAVKPKIDIAGNPKHANSRGLEQWAKIQNLKNTTTAFNLVMEYGGLGAFHDLMAECKADLATIENGIKANEERITALHHRRDDIATYHRTRPIYKQYEETKLFKERFRKKHEDEIIAHENAREALRGFKRPLPKAKDITAEIKRIETANIKNGKSLSTKMADWKQLKNILSHLHEIKREHEPQRQPKQDKHSRKTEHERYHVD